jgi:hypothetical protein
MSTSLAELELDPADVRTALGSVSFMPRFLVQTTMPHSDPGELSAWTRENGRSRLTIQPFIEAGRGRKLKNYGIPYGAIPRLIIAFIGTEVVVKDSPVIELGDCLSGFMGELGMVSKRGRWGTNERLKEQMRRIATCKIAYTEDAPIGAGRHGRHDLGVYRDVSMVQGYDSFWKRVHPDQTALWSSTLTLTQQAFDSFREHPVPVNMLTLRALSRSPLALDLYTWLSHRLFRLQGPTKTISYELLADQFGSQYKETKLFKRRFNEALGRVLAEYKEAKVELVEGGVRLRPSKPHVKQTKFLEGKD